MSKTSLQRWQTWLIIGTIVFFLGLIVWLFILYWPAGVIGLFGVTIIAYFFLRALQTLRSEWNAYIETLSSRIKWSVKSVVDELPIGIVLYNEDYVVEWHNPFVSHMVGSSSVIGRSVLDFFPMLEKNKEQSERHELKVKDHVYDVHFVPEERFLYFTNISEHIHLNEKYEAEKLALGMLLMDNLDEVTQGMDDQTKSIMLAKVTNEITEWSNHYGILLRRTSSDKFIMIMNKQIVKRLEKSRFDILDEVRDLTLQYQIPLTLSIGVAVDAASLIELGSVAQSSLDIALGRGGDQVAVKEGQKINFYGGKSNAVEKRTRVRARVISHALRDLIKDSDKIIIMGHKLPDMDSIGAAIGILKAAKICNREGYIVLEGINSSIERLMLEIERHEHLKSWFITPEQALQLTSPRTLAVVLDTHKASMVAEPKLLQLTNRIVVVDHHRRGEEFINEATLVYTEPYASSTCELVTELLQYIDDNIQLGGIEATAILAGIVVDTKSFSLRTGARTFEAASFLRRNGADSGLIQRLLKEDLDEYIKKAEVIKHAEMLFDDLAIAVTNPGKQLSQLLIAKVADTLLNMHNVTASFVISERQDGLIGISARSLGQINVQVVMERLGGGGHLTNAAVQLDCSLQEAETLLKSTLQEMKEEGLIE